MAIFFQKSLKSLAQFNSICTNRKHGNSSVTTKHIHSHNKILSIAPLTYLLSDLFSRLRSRGGASWISDTKIETKSMQITGKQIE